MLFEMEKVTLTVLALSWLTAFSSAKAGEIVLDQYLNATAEQPYDMSAWVQNASCQDKSAWSRNAQDAAAGYNKHNTEFDSEVYKGIGIESWYWSPVTNADLIWQDVSDLLPGTYVVTAYAVAQVYNDAATKGTCQPGLYLKAGEGRAAITGNKWQQLSVTCTVKAGETLTIGITADSTNLNDWTSISHVTLSCIAPGQAEEIALSEDYDVACVKGSCFANVLLKRTLPDDCLTALCLPFDVDSTLTSQYFAEVLAVTAATPHGNDFVLTTSSANDIQAGGVYLVRANDGNRSCYAFDRVLVDMKASRTQDLGECGTLQGYFRQTLTTQTAWLLQEDGQTCHLTAAPKDLKAFGASIVKQ